jgi:hypothetical protein
MGAGNALGGFRFTTDAGSTVHGADLVQNLPVKVKRAYARTLHIKIPWTRLTSVPVEVRPPPPRTVRSLAVSCWGGK